MFLLLFATPPSGGGLFAPLLTDADSFYSPTVGRGPVTLHPPLLSDGDMFYSPTVGGGAGGATQTLHPPLLVNTSVFFRPTVSGGADIPVMDPKYLVTPGIGSRRFQRFNPITPDGKPSLSVSFARMLPAGETIASADIECVVHPLSAVTDTEAAKRLAGANAISEDGKVISQFFSGGADDVDYILTFIATYSNGEIVPVDVVLSVRAYLNVGT